MNPDDFFLGFLAGAGLVWLAWLWLLRSLDRRLDRMTKPKTKGKP